MHIYNTPFYVQTQVEKYKVKKRANLILANVLEHLGERSAENVRKCMTEAIVRWCDTCEQVHVAGMMCCRHRLCPICQTKRSRIIARQAIEAITLLRMTGRLENTSMHLLTLTQKNVQTGQLTVEIDQLLEALKRMRHVRDVRNYVVGMARNIEVTRNYEYHTWHPHIHIILILQNGKAEMQKVEYWQSLWSNLMGLSYVPEINIKPIEDDGAIYEVSKYVAKSMELLTNVQGYELVESIEELNRATRNRVLVAYTGLWRIARRELKQVDNVDDLIEMEDKHDACKCGGALLHAMMIWDGNEYVWKTSPELCSSCAEEIG